MGNPGASQLPDLLAPQDPPVGIVPSELIHSSRPPKAVHATPNSTLPNWRGLELPEREAMAEV